MEIFDEILEKGEIFGIVEVVKIVLDFFMFFLGEIVEFNDVLEFEFEKVNIDFYGNGWMIKIKMFNF